MKKFKLILIFSVVIIFGSCKKQTTEDSDWTSMQDQNTADLNSDLIMKEVESASTNVGL